MLATLLDGNNNNSGSRQPPWQSFRMPTSKLFRLDEEEWHDERKTSFFCWCGRGCCCCCCCVVCLCFFFFLAHLTIMMSTITGHPLNSRRARHGLLDRGGRRCSLLLLLFTLEMIADDAAIFADDVFVMVQLKQTNGGLTEVLFFNIDSI